MPGRIGIDDSELAARECPDSIGKLALANVSPLTLDNLPNRLLLHFRIDGAVEHTGIKFLVIDLGEFVESSRMIGQIRPIGRICDPPIGSDGHKTLRLPGTEWQLCLDHAKELAMSQRLLGLSDQ